MLLLVFAHWNMRRSSGGSASENSPKEWKATHLYAKMSAACSTGYVKSPVFKRDSSTSVSSFAFRDAARRA